MTDNNTTNETPYMRLELVPVPVSDVDRAIEFYAGKLGCIWWSKTSLRCVIPWLAGVSR
jgi:hypothetical protein